MDPPERRKGLVCQLQEALPMLQQAAAVPRQEEVPIVCTRNTSSSEMAISAVRVSLYKIDPPTGGCSSPQEAADTRHPSISKC
jgi:hypothetical protein